MTTIATQELWPDQKRCYEVVDLVDQDGNAWQIRRIINGFYLKYCGSKQFAPGALVVGKYRLQNTGIFFVHNSGFDAYTEYRSIVMDNTTAGIWEKIQELFHAKITNWEKKFLC